MRILKVMAIVCTLLFVGAFAAQAQVEVAGIDGKGQALIYPYYNITQPAGLNFLRLVNTAEDQGVGVKVRLRRAKESAEVVDFYVCLSAKDEWSGWIAPVVDITGDVVGGRIVSGDSPNLPETPTYPDLAGLIPFQFNAGDQDVNLEGYVEVISVAAWDDLPAQRTVTSPDACRSFIERTASDYPGNVLIGDMHLINADRDADSLFAYNATALKDFASARIAEVSLESDSPPLLSSGSDGLAGVEAALVKETAHIMHTDVFSANGVPTPYTGQTDFVVLFPTKNLSFPSEAVAFKARKWDNAEHTELVVPFPSPVIVTPKPFKNELNYVRIGADVEDDPTAATIFENTDDVYWGNIESLLLDQALLDYIEVNYVRKGLISKADLDANVPAYTQGYIDLKFLSSAYDPLGIRSEPSAKPRPAIVLKLEKISDLAIPQCWTHALEAQYDLP